jgi:hypothetical protein
MIAVSHYTKASTIAYIRGDIYRLISAGNQRPISWKLGKNI